MQVKHENESRWDRRRAQTYQRLLEAGERLFRLHGFDATTVEQVAASADVAKGTFFNYFSSKEALLGRLLHARLHMAFEQARDSDASPEDQIWGLLVAVRRELLPYFHLFRQMFAYALSHPGLQAADDRGRTLAQALTQIISAGQMGGTFRAEIDPNVAGALIATLFFRLSVVECVQAEGDAAADCEFVPDCQTGEGLAADFCWESQMRAGLQILYDGLKGK